MQILSSRFRAEVLAFAVLILGVTTRAEAQQLYGITVTGSLIKIDITSGFGTIVLPGASVSMNTIGLGFRSGKLYTFDNNVGGFRQLDPNTGQIIDPPIIVSGLGAAPDGDFTFRSDGLGYFIDGGPFPVMHSFDLATLTSSALFAFPMMMNVRGLAADPMSSNRLYAFESDGEVWQINITTGAVVKLGGPLVFSCTLGGLAFSPGGSLFMIEN